MPNHNATKDHYTELLESFSPSHSREGGEGATYVNDSSPLSNNCCQGQCCHLKTKYSTRKHRHPRKSPKNCDIWGLQLPQRWILRIIEKYWDCFPTFSLCGAWGLPSLRLPSQRGRKKGKSLKRVSGESFTAGEGAYRVKLKPKRIIDQGVGNCQVFKKVWWITDQSIG